MTIQFWPRELLGTDSIVPCAEAALPTVASPPDRERFQPIQSERRRSAIRDRTFSGVHAGLRGSNHRLWLALLGIVIAATAVITAMITFEFPCTTGSSIEW
jgi:hypothetical protein